MLLQFKKRDSLEKIHEIFEVYSKSKCSKLKVSLSENGRHEVLDENKNLLIINPKIDSFSILNQILEYYKGAIGIDECYFIFNKIEKCSYFSEHIIKKAKDAIFSKNIYFKFEAQFPPIIIRRPEKNTYYATTFNVILTKFICLAHEKSIELKTNPDLIIFQNMERCDRCSMRLIQNLFLYLKKFPFNFEFVFKHNSNLSAETSFCIDSYIKSRKHCFKKILAVSQTVGGIDDFLDVNDFVDKIDFYDSFFYNKEHVCWNENLSEIDNMMDLIYKSNYEKFYCLFELFPENKKEENYTNLNKLLLLANSYNYNFNDSLYTIRNIKLENVQDIIYFKFMEGLIVLKKNKDLELSESIFNECTKIIDGEVKCLELEIERGFIDNAKNLIKVIKISSLKDKDLRSIGISKIIENEHQILNRLLSSYISSPDAKINDKHNLLSLNFIITTVLGNISKLYSMIGDHLSIVKLYESYNYILEVISERMNFDNYKNSYNISFSHATMHIKLHIASQKAKSGLYEEAYNMTKELIDVCNKYDITGNYRGYVLNAHSIYCNYLNKKEESFNCLLDMVDIYINYNEPYMIKLSLNGLGERISEYDKGVYEFLKVNSIIDTNFTKHDEVSFMVSSVVDLENSLQGGLDRHLTQDGSTKEIFNKLISHQDITKSIYKAYGFWRQIYMNNLSNSIN